jgi:hypothetical protein
MTLYEKETNKVKVSNKFIYCVSVYKIWKEGANLVDESYYSSDKPLKFKNNKLKKKDHIMMRYIDLEYAPEEFLINNGYKKL